MIIFNTPKQKGIIFNKMKSILNVFSKVAENENITIGKLEQIIGASKGVLSRAIAQDTDIQTKWLLNLVENYPQYNPEWLLTGKGSMLKSPNKEVISNVLEEPAVAYGKEEGASGIGIPLIPVEAMAGIGLGQETVLELDCERFVVPTFKGAEFLIQVKGSSMYPKYNSGDIVACKRLNLNDIFFQWNKVYVLDTEQGALIKRVCKGKEPDCILIVSDNEKYEPFELHKSKINSIAIVMGVIRLE